MKNWKPYLAVLIAQILWSTSTIATKDALQVFTPLTLVALRFSMAVGLMFLIGLLFRKLHYAPLALVPMDKKDALWFFLGGFFQPFLYYIFEEYAITYLDSPTIAEAFISAEPLFAPLLAFLILKDRISVNNIVGILLSTVGMLVLVLFGSENFAIGNPWGILLALMAVLSAVSYTIVLKKIPERYNSLSIVCYVQLMGLGCLLPVWGVVDLPHIISAPDVLTANPLLSKALLEILYLAVFASIAAFALFCYTVRHLGVTSANAFSNIKPVITALMMLVFFHEQLPLVKWLGIVVVVVGLYICQCPDGTFYKRLRGVKK